MSDNQFIREINEELRHERLMKLWERHSVIIVGAALLIVAATGGWRAWEWYQARESAKAGTLFEQTLALADSGKRAESEAQLSAFLNDAPAGYKLLGRFRLAAEIGERDATAGVAAYDSIAADSSIDSSLRDLARIRAALLLVDTAPAAEIQQRVENLAVAGAPFRHSAKEIIGLARYRAGDRDAARAVFSDLIADPETPPALKSRAQVMQALVPGGANAPAKPNSATQ
jgi:hypothetical protein